MAFGLMMVVFSRLVTAMPSVYGADTRPHDPGGGQDAGYNNEHEVKWLPVEDYFVQYANVRNNIKKNVEDDGESLATMVAVGAFLVKHDILESEQKNYEDHEHWYMFMEYFNHLWFERREDIAELRPIYNLVIEKLHKQKRNQLHA